MGLGKTLPLDAIATVPDGDRNSHARDEGQDGRGPRALDQRLELAEEQDEEVVPHPCEDEGSPGRVQGRVQDRLRRAEGCRGAGAGLPGWQLTGEWKQRAKEELLEVPDMTPSYLERLRALVRGDCKLRACEEDAFLIRFLRARKFNVTRAFKLVQRYYEMKRRHPNLFRVDNTYDLQAMMSAKMHAVLDGRDRSGCRVLIVRLDRYDANVLTVDDFFRLNVVALEQMAREPESQVSGIRVVVDLGGFGLQHSAFLGPYYAMATSQVVQDSFPLRFKGFHVVNEPFYFATLFSVIKPFLKEKIRSRVTLHGSRYSELHDVIPVELLPEDYGGVCHARPLYQRWAGSVRALEGYFQSLESYGYRG